MNKADGSDEDRATRAARQISGALHIFRGGDDVPVLTCSALRDVRVDAVWNAVTGLHEQRRTAGVVEERRRQQAVRWMWSLVDEQVNRRLKHDPSTRELAAEMEHAVRAGRVPAVEAAVRVVERLLGRG